MIVVVEMDPNPNGSGATIFCRISAFKRANRNRVNCVRRCESPFTIATQKASAADSCLRHGERIAVPLVQQVSLEVDRPVAEYNMADLVPDDPSQDASI